jgi:predicted ester cyclase
MSPEDALDQGARFVRLMKHYVVDYANSQDQGQTEFVMEPDYVLRMGEHRVIGRDGAYAAATRKQFEQFPGLGLTVHEIVTNGDRLAMRFSEHGASSKHSKRLASWGGIGLYAWNGERLTSNNVEQDYFSRARQLAGDTPNAVEAPAIAPWDTDPASPDAGNEAVVRGWLTSGTLAATPGVILDDAWAGHPAPAIVEQEDVEINDLFSCGSAVAFHVTQRGKLHGGSIEGAEAGQTVGLHMAGLVHVRNGQVAEGRIIRDRLGLSRALAR